MPWHVAKSGKCPASKPWAVIKDSDGSVAGCHESETAANDQLAALYANEKDAAQPKLLSGRLRSVASLLTPTQPSMAMLGRKATRVSRAEIRMDGPEDSHRFWARVLNYDVIDDFGTLFAPRSFHESLQQRLPRIVWAHNWEEPLGRYIDYDDKPEYLDLLGEYDDFDHVPRARQAYYQMKSGTVDQFSIGFLPQDGEMVEIRDARYLRFTRSRLDEVSNTLAGAVPGTELMALRSRAGGRPVLVRAPVPTISKDLAAQTILDLHEGRMDIADALMAIKTAPVAEDPETPPGETPPGAPPETPPAAPETPEGSQTPPAPETPPATPPATPETPPAPAPAEPPAQEPPATEPQEVPPTPATGPPSEPGSGEDYSDVESILLTHGIG